MVQFDEEEDDSPVGTEPIKFGSYKPLSEQEYSDIVHAPDTYGRLGRTPSSNEEGLLAEERPKLNLDPIEEDVNTEIADAEQEQTFEEPDAELSVPDISQPRTSIPTMSPISATEQSPLDRYRNYISEYEKLQTNRQKMDLGTNLLAAASKIGQSMAGRHSGRFDPDLTGIKMLQEAANRPVTDFESRQKIAQQGIGLQNLEDQIDPTSQQSTLVRKYLNQSIFKDNPLPDTVSAADAALLLKTIGKPQSRGGQVIRTFNPETGQVELKIFDPATQTLKNTNEIAGFALQPRIDPRTGELILTNTATGQRQGAISGPAPVELPPEGKEQEITPSNLSQNSRKLLQNVRKEFLDDTKDDRTALNAAQGVQMTLASGEKIGGDILREIQNQLARGSGEKGAMTDNDVRPFGGRASLRARIERYISMEATGGLPDKDRKFLIEVAKVMEQRARTYIDNRSEFFINNLQSDLQADPNLKNIKVTKNHAKKLIGEWAPSSLPQTNDNEEKRITKDGRPAIFDRKTKKFLRWADEAQ